MISTQDLDRIEGCTAYDNAGNKLGKVDQVYLDDQTNEPNWVTVNTGLFGTSQSFVPLEGASFDGDGLRLAHSKDRIKDAPRIDTDQHLDVNEEQELYRYYGLGYGTGYDDSASGFADTGTTTGHGETGTTGMAGTTGMTTGTADYAETSRTTGDQASVQLNEERVRAGTEAHEAGRARLRKYVTTETETVQVPVSKERLVVERTPATGTSTGAISDTGEVVEEITLREERAVVDKETVAVEEVRVGKETVTETEQVSAEVRKEHADLDVDGSVDSGTRTTGTTGTTGGTTGTGV